MKEVTTTVGRPPLPLSRSSSVNHMMRIRKRVGSQAILTTMRMITREVEL